MRRRFDKETGGRYPHVTFGTFHSVFFHILSAASPAPLSVLSGREQKALLRHLLAAHLPDAPKNDPLHPELCAAALASYKLSGRIRRAGGFSALFPDDAVFDALYREYERFLHENGKIDFEDMTIRCHALLSSDAELLASVRKQYRWFLVDEFQDINAQQFALLRLMACGDAPNLFMVGDDDQSIYGFRGSSPEIFRQLPREFPGLRRLLLSVNYRSGAPIVESSLRVIGENTLRIPKAVRAAGEGGSVRLLPFEDAGAEYAWLGRELEACAGRSGSCAVIFRNHAQAAELAGFLRKQSVPFEAAMQRENPLRQEIRLDILGYFRLAAAAEQGQSCLREDLYRVMNRPARYFSRSAVADETFLMEEIAQYYHAQPVMHGVVLDFMQDLSSIARLRPALAFRYLRQSVGYEEALLDRQGHGGREQVLAELSRIEALLAGAGTAEEAVRLLEAEETGEGRGQAPDREFCRDRSCSRERDGGKENSAGKHPASRVRILTMHASKGLEFDRVYLPDLNEGILPGRRARDLPAIEEERRLLYVAMTRARKELSLLYLAGTPDNPRRPSRFLSVLGAADPMGPRGLTGNG